MYLSNSISFEAKPIYIFGYVSTCRMRHLWLILLVVAQLGGGTWTGEKFPSGCVSKKSDRNKILLLIVNRLDTKVYQSFTSDLPWFRPHTLH